MKSQFNNNNNGIAFTQFSMRTFRNAFCRHGIYQIGKAFLTDAKEWVCWVTENNEAHEESYVMFFSDGLKFLSKFKIQARLVKELVILGRYAIVIHEQPDNLSLNATVYSSNPPYDNIYHASYTIFIHDKHNRYCNIKIERSLNTVVITAEKDSNIRKTVLCLENDNIYNEKLINVVESKNN